jgi:formate hydrogenlyase subunit 6/NADH:ubiquinone oxidoreductase subunit I
MIGSLKGLAVTLATMMRRPVTAQYPDPERRLPIDERFMGFPSLLWDYSNDEPYCTGCMVCVRECPTQCMTADMSDNARFESGESTRKKIIEKFEINLGRCILCGICVDVCNFDAIEMSHEHELGKFDRNANRAGLETLLALGKTWQSQTGWSPTKTKNIGDPDTRARQQADEKAAKAGAVPVEVVSPEALKSARAEVSEPKPEAGTGTGTGTGTGAAS